MKFELNILEFFIELVLSIVFKFYIVSGVETFMLQPRRLAIVVQGVSDYY